MPVLHGHFEGGAGDGGGGVRFILTDRKAFRSVRLGYALGKVLHRLYPDRWNRKRSDGLLFNQRILAAILADTPLDEIEAMAAADLEAFEERSERCRIYKRWRQGVPACREREV